MKRFCQIAGVIAVGLLVFYAGYRLRAHRTPEPAAPAIHLNRHYHFTELMRKGSLRVEFSHYRSEFDHSLQSLWIMEPQGRKPERLFFFFHGMDGDAGDSVVVRDLAEQLNARVISPGGRGPSWISDAFLADSAQLIRQHAQGFTTFYFAGISMGATQALALAALLPQAMRPSLAGVLAMMPGVDLARIARESSVEGVRRTLLESVLGEEKILKQRSPLFLTKEYAPSLSLGVFLETQDNVLDVASVRDFIRQARAAGHAVSVFSTPGQHRFYFTQFPYRDFFESLGKDGDRFLKEIR